MSKLGILPAAGVGSRWGGACKELLPIGVNRWLIDSALDHLLNVGVTRICIVTSERKISTHVLHFSKSKYDNLEIFFVIQRRQQDLWGAIQESFPYTEAENYMLMPDTLFKTNKLQLTDPLTLGMFTTDHPEKFGVLYNGSIVDKSPTLIGTHSAWGTISWNEDMVKYWKSVKPNSFPEALSLGLSVFPSTTYSIESYEDIASWNDYVRLFTDGVTA